MTPTGRKQPGALCAEIRVSEKLCSDITYSVLGCEFCVRGSTIYIKEDVCKHQQDFVLMGW